MGRAVVCRQLFCSSKAFATAIAFIVHLSTGSFATLAELGSRVGAQLLLGAKSFAALLAGMFLEGKVKTQMVLHGQAVGIGRVADIAVILSNLVEVLVIGQTASMSIGPPTLITGKWASPPL